MLSLLRLLQRGAAVDREGGALSTALSFFFFVFQCCSDQKVLDSFRGLCTLERPARPRTRARYPAPDVATLQLCKLLMFGQTSQVCSLSDCRVPCSSPTQSKRSTRYSKNYREWPITAFLSMMP